MATKSKSDTTKSTSKILHSKLAGPGPKGRTPAKPITKTALVRELAAKFSVPIATSAAFLDVFTAIAYREVRKFNEFTVPGLGKLVRVKRKARTSRNPKTGEPLKIAAKTVLKFRVSKLAKNVILN